jgi:hypothetical protein
MTPDQFKVAAGADRVQHPVHVKVGQGHLSGGPGSYTTRGRSLQRLVGGFEVGGDVIPGSI